MENSKEKPYALMVLISMCVMTFCSSGVTWSTFSLYAAYVVKDLGITGTQFMFSMTILVIINAMCSIFLYGIIQSRLGLRKIIIIGGVLLALAQAVFAFSNSLIMLYAGAVIMGFAIVPLTGNTMILAINSWYKKRAGTYIGMANTVGSIAGVMSAAVYGSLIIHLGWRIPLLITCAIDALGLVLMIIFFKGTPEEVGVRPMYSEQEQDEHGNTVAVENETGLSLREMLKSPRFYMLSLAYLLIGIVGYGAMGNLALMMSDMGFSNLAGTAVSATLFGSAATMVLSGVICDKAGSKWFVSLAMVLAGAAMLILRITNIPVVLIYVAAVLLGISYNATQFPAGIAVKEVFGTKEYGKKIGIVNGCCLIGLGFGPTIMQAVTGISGNYSNSLLIFAGTAFIAIALLMISSRKTIK